MPDTKPRCEGISKRTGERCTAYPAKGGSYCAGHAGYGVAADPTAYASRGGVATAAVRRERAEERRKTLLDRIAEGLEERAQEILDAYMAAGFERGDWRALEALVTRVHGKPVERVETTDARGVEEMTDAERTEARRWLMDELEARRQRAA